MIFYKIKYPKLTAKATRQIVKESLIPSGPLMSKFFKKLKF